MTPEEIATVRRFNRLATKRAGALEERFLGRDRPLGQSRTLFEIGRDGATLRGLRGRLDLDSGYLSRLVHGLVAGGMVEIEPAEADERVRHARLTGAGLAELDEINRRSDEVAAATLAPLTPSQRDRLVKAMAEVTRLLRCAAVRIERVDPTSPEARACVSRYFAELNRRFPAGFDPASSIPVDDAQLVPPDGAFLLAELEGESVACGSLKRIDASTVYLKRMWVADGARGLGLGRRMLAALEQQARELDFTTIRLETNRTLTEAIQLYRTSGYAEVEAFNDEPYAHHWFEKPLR